MNEQQARNAVKERSKERERTCGAGRLTWPGSLEAVSLRKGYMSSAAKEQEELRVGAPGKNRMCYGRSVIIPMAVVTDSHQLSGSKQHKLNNSLMVLEVRRPKWVSGLIGSCLQDCISSRGSTETF